MNQFRNSAFDIHDNNFIDIVTPGSPIHLSKYFYVCLQAFGPVSQMDESVVTQMGCITQGFSNPELEMFAFSMDTLEEIARCNWNKSQVQYKDSSIYRLLLYCYTLDVL